MKMCAEDLILYRHHRWGAVRRGGAGIRESCRSTPLGEETCRLQRFVRPFGTAPCHASAHGAEGFTGTGDVAFTDSLKRPSEEFRCFSGGLSLSAAVEAQVAGMD